MPSRCLSLTVVLPFLLVASPVRAQQADTTRVDSAATDTTRAGAPESAATGSDSTAAPPLEDVAEATPGETVARSGRRPMAKARAKRAASSWLSHTDAGRFAESWDRAASVLQQGIAREDWIEQGARARSRLDSLQTRTLAHVQYRDSTRQVPGNAPVVTLQYQSQFEGGSVLEAVVMTRQDTTWKVAGYRVVPSPDTIGARDTTKSVAVPDSARSP